MMGREAEEDAEESSSPAAGKGREQCLGMEVELSGFTFPEGAMQHGKMTAPQPQDKCILQLNNCKFHSEEAGSPSACGVVVCAPLSNPVPDTCPVQFRQQAGALESKVAAQVLAEQPCFRLGCPVISCLLNLPGLESGGAGVAFIRKNHYTVADIPGISPCGLGNRTCPVF